MKPTPTTGPPVRRRRRRGWCLAAAGLGAVTAFALLEIAVRVLDVGPDVYPVYRSTYRLSEDPDLIYEHVPGARGDGFTLNERGWRGPVVRPKQPGVVRIACIGDSVTFGYGVDDPDTFPRHLERQLNARCAEEGRRFEVYNFGVTGYNATQVAAALRTYALNCDPDLVIYGYCLNDPSGYSVEMAGVLRKLTSADYRYYRAWTDRGRRLLARSRAWLLMRYAWDSFGDEAHRTALPQSNSPQPDWQRTSPLQYYQALHESPEPWSRVPVAFADIAAATAPGDVPAYVALFPFLQDLQAHPFEEIHRRVGAAAEAAGLSVVDLAPPFIDAARASDEPLGVDRLHPTARGHAVAAAAVIARLRHDGFLIGGCDSGDVGGALQTAERASAPAEDEVTSTE